MQNARITEDRTPKDANSEYREEFENRKDLAGGEKETGRPFRFDRRPITARHRIKRTGEMHVLRITQMQRAGHLAGGPRCIRAPIILHVGSRTPALLSTTTIFTFARGARAHLFLAHLSFLPRISIRNNLFVSVFYIPLLRPRRSTSGE